MSTHQYTSRRRFLLTLTALPWAESLAAAPKVNEVRVWPAREYTRLTIESDAALTHSMLFVRDPLRLVIDIEDIDLAPVLRDIQSKIVPSNPMISGVRAARYKPNVVRLVLDLKADTRPQVFSHPPVAQYGHRLLVDLYPVEAPDVIGEFLGQLERRREGAAASTVSGALSPIAAPQTQPISPPPSPSAIPAGVAGRSPAPVTAQSSAPEPPKLATPPASAPPINSKDATSGVAPKPSSRNTSPPQTEPGRGKLRPWVVAIDPGHGGEDPGAIGPNGVLEKDVVLAIAHKLKAMVDAHPHMRAFLTREDDYFVPLAERVNKARAVSADVFLSIHADAFVRPEAHGSSVYQLSERGASSSAASWLANKENAADSVGGYNRLSNVSLVGRSGADTRILLDLAQTKTNEWSSELGEAILGQIGKMNRLHKKTLERAGFAVLKAPDVASILIETAFLSNPDEEDKLADEGFRRRMATAIFKGVDYHLNRRRVAR